MVNSGNNFWIHSYFSR